MDGEKTYYVDVLLPLHLPDTYTYRVPREMVGEVRVGVRVVVQFGQKRIYSALVRRVHTEAPQWKAKYVMGVLDSEPVATERQMQFWEWMARYYMCYPGDVMAVALPAGLKMQSESTVMISPEFDGDLSRLTRYETMVVNLLTEHPVMKLADLSRAIGVQKIMPLIRTMIEREVVVLEEELRERFVPKKSAYVRLSGEWRVESGEWRTESGEHPGAAANSPLSTLHSPLAALFDELERKHRTAQVKVLMQFLQLSDMGREAVAKRALPQGSALQTLIKNGVLVVEEHIESRLREYSDDEIADPNSIVLNEEQQKAFDYISGQWSVDSCQFNDANTTASAQLTTDHRPPTTKPITLLHGVTSSGKTEVYIKLIAEVVAQGRQALFLLPEIALTAQIINRLRRYFGDKVGVYHSRFSASQRAEVWQRTGLTPQPPLQAGEGENGGDCSTSLSRREGWGGRPYQVLLGARSALFLPFSDLALVIVDEEHDPSYKQYDPAPRYNARDAAIYLANMWGARVVLGSATPSVESYYNAMNGKYGYVAIRQRYGGFSLPELTCVDMREARKNGQLRGHFSTYLLDQIRNALASGKQVILFQNRRGFSLRLECNDCHQVPQCVHCDVSLVYHKATNSLRCHYCGYSIPVPSECPHCHSTHLQMVGIGTERIEEDLQIMFPDARVARMDLDSTMQKNQYMELLTDFQNRRIDILVGTQMVTKGLDFEHVSVVGIVSADNLINFPSFRSYERSFQQMTQVSGRAGRHADGGRVVIQTYCPEHIVIQNVLNGDYESLYEEQIQERRVFRYPPYYRLISITLKHRDAELLNHAADWMAVQLRGAFGSRVMGPEYPLVSRIRALYLKCITLRFERTEAIADAKKLIMHIADDLQKQEGYSGVLVAFDVDPY